jgi:riboflavin kinase / FMN adenylyltransferase
MLVQSEVPSFTANTAITIGNFDGVHLGHQKLIEHLVEKAVDKNMASAVITLNPHPMEYFFPERKFLRITNLAEMEVLLEAMGLDYLIQLAFTEKMANLSPGDFVKSILIKRFKPGYIIVGEDHLFGKDRKGTPRILKKLAVQAGIEVDIEKQYEMDGAPVSSTRIRHLIQNGNLDQARKLLGHDLFFTGPVVRGSGRGMKMGTPTANLFLPDRVLPPPGVYASKTKLDDNWFPSISYVGKSPTFNGDMLCLETHIMMPMGTLYGRMITVTVVKWLRQEILFESRDKLICQIQKDLIHAKHVLTSGSEGDERNCDENCPGL